MGYESITLEKQVTVGILTLNRPERLNAWTTEMNREIIDAIGDCNDDPAIGAIIVTGAGRGFCAGADIKDNFKARIESGCDEGGGTSVNYIDFIRQSKPIIAAVNGAAVGVGVTMMLPFDIIMASEQARFGLAFVKMGVVPELASSHFLVARLGFGAASEMCLTGRLYSADEAHEFGLANHVVPASQLLDRATALAKEIAGNPSRQLRMTKSLLTRNGSETDLNAVMKREGEALEECYASAEHKEAVQAFIEKRAPDFRNPG
ncbi:MAG: enoyl-CoA hydratase [Gammaproteobacteria bacterium]|nr:enoyl-CoA hydratase [Gammaproteobacteria bacterium]RPG25528.1 MAG: enoyl-CoA hydratase [Gammaproteobacteria bacterium TMED50]